MLFVKALQNSLHQGLSKKFRLVGDTVAAAINPESPGFPVVKHNGNPVVSF